MLCETGGICPGEIPEVGTTPPFLEVEIAMKKLLSFLRRTKSRAESIATHFSCAIVLVMVLLSTADVICRYVFNSPIPGGVELEVMCLIALIYLGLPYVQSIRGHINLEILHSHVTPITQKYLTIFGHIVCLVPFAMITWQGSMQAIKSWMTGEFEPGIVRYPLGPAKTAIAIGALLFCLRLISDIVIDFRNITAGTKNGAEVKENAT